MTNFSQKCTICNAPEEIQSTVLSMHNDGESLTRIASWVSKNYHSLERKAVRNHIKNHAPIQPLLGVVTPPERAPKGWEAKAEFNGETGTIVSTPQKDGDITDFDSILLEFGVDPEEYEVAGSARMSKWQTAGGEWRTSYKINFQKKRIEEDEEDQEDLGLLFQDVFKERRAQVTIKDTSPEPQDRALVVLFADLQTGKVGSRGGTSELIDRTEEKKEKLLDYMNTWQTTEAAHLDLGDIVEGFENTAQQSFTNDLSSMQQIETAAVIEQGFIQLLADTHDYVQVAGIPSNHTAWRNGKNYLGRPGDDWGIYILKSIQRAFGMSSGEYDHVEFNYPGEWEKHMTIDVLGTGLGMTHGDDSSLANMETWWAKQVHGGGPLAKADVLNHGHYHTFRMAPSGRNLEGKQKWMIGASTLDSGSDWFANKDGSDSDAGMVVYTVTKDGLDLQSLTIL